MGYDGTINPWFYAFLGSCLWANNVVCILATILIISLHRILKKSQKQNRWSPKTLEMQWMLFKTFCLSTVSAVMLLLVPIILLAIMGVTRVQAYAALITNILQVVMACHSMTDYTILMYFILPYRKFCIKCFQRVFFFLKFKKQNQILVKSVATGTGLNKHN